MNAHRLGNYESQVLPITLLQMKNIDDIARNLPDKRKALLHSLVAHNWKVIGVDDSDADWALNEKWLIESTRESKGLRLLLWMFMHDGLYDGMDRVVATPDKAEKPGAYSAALSIEFDTKGFEKQLKVFMESLHAYRIGRSTAN